MVGYLLTRHQTWDLPAPSPGTSDLGPNPPIPWTSDLGHTPCYCHLTSGGRHWRQVVCKRAAGILLEFYLVSTYFRPKKLQSKLKNEHIRLGTYPLLLSSDIWWPTLETGSLQAGSRHPSGILSCFYIFSPKKTTWNRRYCSK